MTWQALYQDFQDWRVRLYEDLAARGLTADEVRTLARDLMQAVDRLERESGRLEREDRTRKGGAKK